MYLFTDGTPTLVDTWTPDMADAVIGDIEAIGASPERVIIAHGDGDRVGGFDAIVDRFDPDTDVPEQIDLDATIAPTTASRTGTRSVGSSPCTRRGTNPTATSSCTRRSGSRSLGTPRTGRTAGDFHRGTSRCRAAPRPQRGHESFRTLLNHNLEIGLVFHGTNVMSDARGKLDRYVNPS